MTGQPPRPHALRVRKARASGRCALCPVPVITGQAIGRLPSGRWAHVTCIIAARRQVRQDLPAPDASSDTAPSAAGRTGCESREVTHPDTPEGSPS